MQASIHVVRLLVVACLLFVAPLRVGADAPAAADREDEAARHFQRGVELFKEQSFRPALGEFQRAYEIAPDPRLFFNIGRVQVKLSDYLSAARSYERYLNEGGQQVPPDRRARVEEELIALRARVGRIGVTSDRAGAEVLLDDVKVGSTPLASALLVNPGRHLVAVRAGDGATNTRVVEVAAGDVALVELSLAGQASATSEAASSARPWTKRRKATLVTAGVGALLLAGGAVAGGLAYRANREFEQVLDGREVDRAAYDDARQRVNVRSLSADILVGTGAATVLTAAVLWLVGPERTTPTRAEPARAQPARARLDVGLGSLSVRGTF